MGDKGDSLLGLSRQTGERGGEETIKLVQHPLLLHEEFSRSVGKPCLHILISIAGWICPTEQLNLKHL